MRILINIVLTLSILKLSTAAHISCETRQNLNSTFGNLTECYATKVNSQELNYKSFSIDYSTFLRDFKSLYIEDSPLCIYLPSRVGELLANVELFYVINTGLKQIISYDLKYFKKLRGLYIERSKLTSIDEDLFRYAKNLEQLSLRDNRIKYVQADVFKQLRNLNSLIFDGNICFNETTDEYLPSLIREIEEKCNIFHDDDGAKDRVVDKASDNDHKIRLPINIFDYD